jgi:Tol biopolymer transport system component
VRKIAIVLASVSLCLISVGFTVGCGGSHVTTITPVTPTNPSNPTNASPAQPPMAAFIEQVNGQRYIYAATNDGSGLSRISDKPGDFNSVYVLPDGSKGVFADRTADGYSQIFYLAPFKSGGTPVQLTSTPGNKTGVMLSADGTRITFLCERPGQLDADVYLYDIAVMNADGSDFHVLPLPAESTYGHPFFSPDSSEIAAAMIGDGCFDGCSVFVVNADGINLRTISPTGVDGMLALTPAFSPDGKQIVFSSVGWDDLSIYIMNADGSGVARLGAANSGWGDPLFVGERILFVAAGQIYGMKADGSDLKRVTDATQAASFDMPL